MILETRYDDRVVFHYSDGLMFVCLDPSMHDFKQDMQKQMIVLMGLPASGKSTFVGSHLRKYFPQATGFKVTNSDNQLVKTQYVLAMDHFKLLSEMEQTEEAFNKFTLDTEYTNNAGDRVQHPVTLEWWKANKAAGATHFYQTFRKAYYATYFDLRAIAKEEDAKLFADKILTAGNVLVIDTVGAKPSSVLNRMRSGKAKGFSCSVIYLEKPVELCIAGDKHRGETSGRTVGTKVIEGYADAMDIAFAAYVEEGNKEDGVVDRTLHFKWHSTGPKANEGTYNLVEDIKHFLKRATTAKVASKMSSVTEV